MLSHKILSLLKDEIFLILASVFVNICFIVYVKIDRIDCSPNEMSNYFFI